MRRNLKGIGIVLLFFIMLASPRAVFTGASEGLLLWFQIVLPTLFPFLLLSSLLIRTGNIHYISSFCAGILSRVFGVSANGSFAVVTGFFCGYPMGAKISADLTASGYISQEEGRYLLSFCNNTSPMFILNFIVWKTLKEESLMLPSLAILMAAPAIVSLFTRKKYLHGSFRFSDSRTLRKKTEELRFEQIDACIMDSFETLVKVGGYIILFSVLLTLFRALPFPLLSWLLPSLEITNGIVLLGAMDAPFSLRYPAILALCAFGGFCSAAQTQCMVQKAGFPLFPYLIEKLAAAVAASLLGFLYVFFLR